MERGIKYQWSSCFRRSLNRLGFNLASDVDNNRSLLWGHTGVTGLLHHHRLGLHHHGLGLHHHWLGSHHHRLCACLECWLLRRLIIVLINGLSNVKGCLILLLAVAAAHNNNDNDQDDNTNDCADDGTNDITSCLCSLTKAIKGC